MTETAPNIAWVDIETTGLDPEYHLPLEVALVITDADLSPLFERSWVIYQQIVLNDLDPKIMDMHTKNGLLSESVQSSLTTSIVDHRVADLLMSTNYFPDYGVKPILAGSSITFDRNWLKYRFPQSFDALHYRSLDVSSFKEAFKRWYPGVAIDSEGTSNHRAMDDIFASIAELSIYRNFIARKTTDLVEA